MDYSFPPPPAGYSIVIGARLILAAWSLAGVGIIAYRLRNWRSIQKSEIDRWWLAVGISYAISFGATSLTSYDNNEWMWPTLLAAVSVSIAGITLGLCKIYVESDAVERSAWIGFNLFAFLVCYFLFFSVMQTPHSTEPSRRTGCKNNLKSIGLAMHNYHDNHGGFVPPINGSPSVSWRVTLLPYLDQQSVYNRYRQRSAWNSTANLPRARERMDVFRCPANYFPKNTDGMWYTAYSMPTGIHTVGASPKGTKLRDITDGVSNTLLIVEACGAQIVWTEPRDVNVDSQPAGINLSGDHRGNSVGWLSSYHAHGTHVLRADGSVWFLSDKADTDFLRKIATINDGEQVEDF